jgi:dual-specificity kinase
MNPLFLGQFLVLLQKTFVYDPARRIAAKEALNHPWFNIIPLPDDGSEAAMIRVNRVKNEATRLAPIDIYDKTSSC